MATYTFDITDDTSLPSISMDNADIRATATEHLNPYKCAHSGLYAPLNKLVREPGTGMLVLPKYSNGRRSIPFSIAPRRK